MTCDTVTLLPPDVIFRLPQTFNFDEYIDSERELWALFPEVTGKRVNFLQAGLSAFLYAEVTEDKDPLGNDETYILMPYSDKSLRPLRMKCVRRLNLEEFRMSTYTAAKAATQNFGTTLQQITEFILGEELITFLNEAAEQQI